MLIHLQNARYAELRSSTFNRQMVDAFSLTNLDLLGRSTPVLTTAIPSSVLVCAPAPCVKFALLRIGLVQDGPRYWL
jgi:hypothetical protein